MQIKCLSAVCAFSAARRESLTSFPFPWAAETCADPLRLSEIPYAHFLHARGLAGKVIHTTTQPHSHSQ